MRRTTLVTIAAAALALTASTAMADDIQIAVAAPITGPSAAIGDQFKRGAEKAVADINAKGGVLGGKLVLNVGDDACDPKQAVAVANQLASEHVIFVAGHYCSGSSIPASAVYNEAGILQISPGSTNPVLTDDAAAKGWTNIFRVCGRDDAQGLVAGKYLAKKYKGKSVAIIDDKSAYGKGLADETRKAMNAAGLKEVVNDEITAGDKDFSALISKLKAAHVSAIYFGGYEVEGGLIVRQAREQNLQVTLIGGDALVTQQFYDVSGPAGDGTLMTFAPDPREVPAAKGVVESFKKDGYDPEGYTLYTYAAIQVFAMAAEKAKSVNLDDVTKVMHSGMTFKTVIGPIQFDQKGDVVHPEYVFYAWKDGKYNEIK
ncbi:MAG: branched-chain amino acid ABC transporter substrate-binding protein [Dongiaceae bacterium]